jgi:hypothetical protein
MVFTYVLLNFFQSNPCKHPILFLRDVAFHHLRALVEFMYAGEVNVAQAQLSAFLRTAESLQIRGLTEAPQRHKQAHLRVSSSSFLSRFQFFGSTVTKKSPFVSLFPFPVVLHLRPFLPSL